MKKIPLIQKEALSGISFQKKEVIENYQLRQDRTSDLNKAVALGNLYHFKVSIIFETEDGITQKVITTIWAVSEDFILLKGGVFVPVKAIKALEL